LTERKNNFELTTRPEREGLARAEQDCGVARLEVEASRVELSRRFSGILARIFHEPSSFPILGLPTNGNSE
jgi:hypothetical protein